MASGAVPLAGRSPFATDDDNEIYSTPLPQPRRMREKPQPDANSRTSAYNMYDEYHDDSKRESGVGALGMGFMNGDLDSDDDDDEPPVSHNKHSALLAAATHPQGQSSNIPLASPRPGYAAPIPVLQVGVPSPAVTPEAPRQPPPIHLQPGQQQPQVQMPQGQRQMQPSPSPRQMQMQPPPSPGMMQPPRSPGGMQMPPPSPRQMQMQMPPSPRQMQMPQPQMAQLPQGLRVGPGSPMGMPPRPFAESPAPSVPSTPHPLEAPVTPITPAFLRPAKSSPAPDSVKFTTEPIIRGNSEDNLIPKRGERGDDFWRRFSMVAKDPDMGGGKESTWLQKTQSGTKSLSRWVWMIGVIFILCIGGGIGVGWYFTHNNPSNQAPETFGGSADEGASSVSVTTSISTKAAKGGATSTSPHVTPTNTVARREAFPAPEPTGAHFDIIHMRHASSDKRSFVDVHFGPKRHSRLVNRTQ